MRKMLLCGCNGRMGQTVSRLAAGRDDIRIVAGCDIKGAPASGYPVYPSPSGCAERPDVLMDFSSPASLDGLAYCLEHAVPLTLCSTGHDAAQLARIELAAGNIPVFRSGNMSLGVYLLMELAKTAATVLGADFDAEIVERHHRDKVDAPSGTALMLYDTLSAALPYRPEPVYTRQPERKKRGGHEIGLHSVRGGTIVGEHEVMFAGHDEVITLSHSARSRDVFAAGAIRAALFMTGTEKPGLYDMRDLIRSLPAR
ncbi:MAG: 4-hydroxy-tetrahydrodipicolinate reductase [Oscillospiraceae bacterium]|jgi:4-hydroxy-tetrahydrodipicolinate reductase|nr:4-hydroxy-tetrahydrodipicolinate reductase [Oscillospiraceae bacterium]